MNKLIFLVAPPRSLSTAFLRMMQARGDFKICNEPATALYNQSHYPHSANFYIRQEEQSYRSIREQLTSQLEKGNVFVKEMSFAFDEFIRSEPSLLEQSNIHFAFLLRNPHHCIISYYKKMPQDYIDHMIGQLSHLTAYRPLYQSYKTICEQAKNKPIILHAEQLISNPGQSVHSFCQQVDIPYVKDSLNWENLGAKFNGQEAWQEHKTSETTHHWHQEAILSTGFHTPTEYAVDEKQRPLFTEIENQEHRHICQQVYDDYLQHYQALCDSRV